MRIWYSDAFKAGYEKGFAKAKKLLDDIDTITVVRCKNCKWFGEDGCAIRIVDDSDKPKENDYCSFAERRSDETD